MSTTSERRAEHIGALVRGYADAVDKLAASAFLPGAVTDALGEALSTRAPFRPLATAPAYMGDSRRVAGSLWHRSVGWHGGNGNLWGLHAVVWDTRSVGRRPEGRGLPASWFVEVDRAGPDGFLEGLERRAWRPRRASSAWCIMGGRGLPRRGAVCSERGCRHE
jgi:hypothetical protein